MHQKCSLLNNNTTPHLDLHLLERLYYLENTILTSIYFVNAFEI